MPRIFDALTDLVGIGGLLLTIVLLASGAHGAISGKPSGGNSIGFLPYSSNPNIYMYASVACHGEMDCGVFERGGKVATAVNFSPAHTSLQFTEEVLFCGDVADSFQQRGPLVITYRRAASAIVAGVACHMLVSVDRVAAKDGK